MFDSVALAIQEFAKKTPDKTALIVGQEHCSYEKLAKKSRQAARFLLEKGIAAGDRVAVEADHTLDYVYLWYGIQLLGATFVPLEKNSPSARMIEIAQELDAKQIISLCERDDMPDFWALSRIMPAIDEMPDDYQASAPDPGSLSEILFTTGTTGKSKGVMVSYQNQMTIAQAGIETINIQTDNIWLIPTPMNHAAALRKVHIAMAVGSTTVLLEGFKNFKLFFKTIEDHKVTSLYLPPSAIHLMLAVASKNLAQLNGQLRFIYSSSASYPETDKEKMRKLLPSVYMYNCFGSSEVGVVCADEFCVSGGSIYPGSIGKPNSFSEILLLDEDGNEKKHASAEDPGYLAIRSKGVMQGYWNEPEQTEKAIQKGMLVMSDLCYFAPNGELIHVGRGNDTIHIGGLKIAPVEVEDVVLRAECVNECLLIPAKRGEQVYLKLLVVPKKGMSLDENAIRQIISDHLEPYKMPKSIVQIPEVLKTFNGKIDRKQMIARYQEM